MGRKSLLISFFFIASGILGFTNQVLYGKYFGASEEMDVYYTLLSIPTLITGISPVIFSSVFLPAFAQYNLDELLSYISSIKRYVFFFSLVFSIIGTIGMFVYIKKTSYANGELESLSVFLCVFLWLNTYFSILRGYMACVYNHYKHFILISVTPLLTYVFILISLFLFHRTLGVRSIVIGMLVASIIQFCIYKFYNCYYFQAQRTKNVDVILICRKIVLVTLSLLPFTAFGAISYFWAGFLPKGAVSYLGYAHSFSGFLSVAASMGVATTSFPDLAKLLGTIDKKKIEKTLLDFEAPLKVVIFVTLFVSIFIVVFIDPLLSLLLLRGKFDFDSVNALAQVLPYYFMGGVCLSVLNLIRNVYYSMRYLTLFVLLSVSITVLFVTLAFLLKEQVSYIGIGLIEFLCLFLFMLSSLVILKFKHTAFLNSSFWIDILKFIIISLSVAALLAWSFNNFILIKNLWLSLLLSGLCYALLVGYLLTGCFKIKEVTDLAYSLMKKINKKR